MSQQPEQQDSKKDYKKQKRIARKQKRDERFKEAVKEIRYHFRWYFKILLFLTSPIWILPTLIVNLIVGKKIYNFLENFPKSGLVDNPDYSDVEWNTLGFYNRDMKVKNAPKQLFISDKEWTELNPEEVMITSFDDTQLATFLFINKKPTNKWIIVLHGWMQNRYSILYLVKPFYEAGYNVLVYDARNHGVSDPSTTTFGKNESRDLLTMIKFLRYRYKGVNLEIALIGNSMGASTLLQALVTIPLKDYGVKAAIFDCGYDDFNHMIKILGQTNLRASWFWFYTGIRTWFQYFDKFNINEVKPIEKISQCVDTPILFIHGTQDQTVPITMTQRLYKEKVDSENALQGQKVSQILIVDGARHIRSITTDYNLYTTTAFDFLDKWFSK